MAELSAPSPSLSPTSVLYYFARRGGEVDFSIYLYRLALLNSDNPRDAAGTSPFTLHHDLRSVPPFSATLPLLRFSDSLKLSRFANLSPLLLLLLCLSNLLPRNLHPEF